MTFVPVPGYGAGQLTPDGNLHAYIDRLVLPGTLYNETYDEDGLLQQMSSIAMALLGATAGHWLRSSGPPQKKLPGFWGGGLASICLGVIWHFLPRPLGFPVIFRLWSSSFVLVTAGYSAIMFGLFYWIIDVKSRKKWAFPLVVIGLNAITIYVGQRIINLRSVVDFFVGGVNEYMGVYKSLFISICYLSLSWLILYFFYKKKIFLKV
jgi:predicted acyltransferase